MVSWPPLILDRAMATEFPLERFLKTASMLESSNEQERATAAKQATAMLTQAGLTWQEVLRRGLSPAAPAAPGMSDLVRDLYRKARSSARSTPPPAPPPAPSPRAGFTPRILQGEDIPHAIEGTVIVRDKRLYEAGKYMLIVGVVSRDRGEQYEPLVVFDPAAMATLEAASAAGTSVRGRVRQAPSELGLPVLILSSG